MTDGPGRDLVVNQTFDLIALALVGALLLALLRRFLSTVPARLAQARSGAASVLTPALNAAVRADSVVLVGRGDPSGIVGTLTDGERDVLALLANGQVPKQAALALGLSVAGVRSRIASAKRKTGTRTLEQLVALHAEASGAR